MVQRMPRTKYRCRRKTIRLPPIGGPGQVSGKRDSQSCSNRTDQQYLLVLLHPVSDRPVNQRTLPERGQPMSEAREIVLSGTTVHTTSTTAKYYYMPWTPVDEWLGVKTVIAHGFFVQLDLGPCSSLL